MGKVAFISLIALCLTACSPCRSVITSETAQDSVRVEVRERVVYVPDTITVEIPAQSSERTTADSLSFLENEYAESTARVNPDGTLFHDLKTKPQVKPVPIDRPVEYRDSIVYRDRFRDRTNTVEVERDLTWWEKTRIYGFYGLLIFFLISYTIKKVAPKLRDFLKK